MNPREAVEAFLRHFAAERAPSAHTLAAYRQRGILIEVTIRSRIVTYTKIES